MVKRKYISKKDRIAVWEKYNHHCAYCGCELEYKDMVVDHFIPFRNIKFKKGSEEVIESVENYFPSCRICNYEKRSCGIESMRKNIENKLKQLDKVFNYKIAKKYGLVQENKHKVKFYFEEFDENGKE